MKEVLLKALGYLFGFLLALLSIAIFSFACYYGELQAEDSNSCHWSLIRFGLFDYLIERLANDFVDPQPSQLLRC